MSQYDEIRYCKEMAEYRNACIQNRPSQRPFTEKEDLQLLEVLNVFDGDRRNIDKKHKKKLVENLGRDWTVIYERLRSDIVKSSGRTRTFKVFTLEEDMVLIDNAMKGLMAGKLLKDAEITNVSKIADSLKRGHTAVQNRWKVTIRTWLLQYYARTLNLQVKPMLAKVLADNFESLKTVDWNSIMKYREFSGHWTHT